MCFSMMYDSHKDEMHAQFKCFTSKMYKLMTTCEVCVHSVYPTLIYNLNGEKIENEGHKKITKRVQKRCKSTKRCKRTTNDIGHSKDRLLSHKKHYLPNAKGEGGGLKNK